MPPESSRIIELRRRVESEPGSIAFAQLAEEYRRAGNYEAAVQTCLTGLARHPAYLSARVTLGRALIELDRLVDAETELQLVLRTAPDNLAAIRGMAEIHQRRGDLEPALDFFRRALPLARHDPELEEAVSQIKRELGATSGPAEASGLSFAQAERELLSAFSRMPEQAGPAPLASAPAAQPPAAGASERAARPAVPDLPLPHLPAIDAPIDFDLLLSSLGLPEAPAPPMVEALLSEPPPTVVRPEPILPELPLEPLADDPFADLERGLREFDQPRKHEGPAFSPAPIPVEQTASSLEPVEESILEELEAWLAALAADVAAHGRGLDRSDPDRVS